MTEPNGTVNADKVVGVVLPFVLILFTLVYLALCPSILPRMPELATVRNSSQQRTSGQRNVFETLSLATPVDDTSFGPRSSREARRIGRDPLRAHRAVVGRDARTPWYIRARSFLALIVIVVCLGMAFAGITLLIIASGRFLLEVLAGN